MKIAFPNCLCNKSFARKLQINKIYNIYTSIRLLIFYITFYGYFHLKKNNKNNNLQPSRLLKSWISEFLGKITLLKPKFVALHLQEVGGKTYEKSMEYVQEFIKELCESQELEDYNRIRVYLDEDYTSAEHFTVIL